MSNRQYTEQEIRDRLKLIDDEVWYQGQGDDLDQRIEEAVEDIIDDRTDQWDFTQPLHGSTDYESHEVYWHLMDEFQGHGNAKDIRDLLICFEYKDWLLTTDTQIVDDATTAYDRAMKGI